jgi:hypothetical protein
VSPALRVVDAAAPDWLARWSLSTSKYGSKAMFAPSNISGAAEAAGAETAGAERSAIAGGLHASAVEVVRWSLCRAEDGVGREYV